MHEAKTFKGILEKKQPMLETKMDFCNEKVLQIQYK